MSKPEIEAELSDLKVQYLYSNDRRQMKRLRERIDHLARQLKILEQREANTNAK
jgi:hypothetical protein